MVMAMVASRATAAMLPGPMAASTKLMRKSSSGTSTARPRMSGTTFCTSAGSVPFSWAMPNTAQTPTSSRNRSAGKPDSTDLTDMSARMVPMMRAAMMAGRPGLTRGKTQLITMMVTSASNEVNANDIGSFPVRAIMDEIRAAGRRRAAPAGQADYWIMW